MTGISSKFRCSTRLGWKPERVRVREFACEREEHGRVAVRAIEIPLPPLSAQREVVARLDSAKARAEKLEAKAREGVVVCETMRKAILKEAFE